MRRSEISRVVPSEAWIVRYVLRRSRTCHGAIGTRLSNAILDFDQAQKGVPSSVGNRRPLRSGCVYRKFDLAWTQRTDGVSSLPDDWSAQADSWRPGFTLQVESQAGGGK